MVFVSDVVTKTLSGRMTMRSCQVELGIINNRQVDGCAPRNISLHTRQHFTMKIAILSLFLVAASAFTVQPRAATTRPVSLVALAAGKPADEAEEEGGLDLDLGEMFDMFEAADKDESFDDAIKKVKKGE